MKLAVALLLVLLCAVPAPSAQSDLDRLVNELQNRYLRLESFSAEFTQLYVAPGERLRREVGRMLLKKPGRMRWDYTSPEVKLYVSDGKVIYEYIPAERTATRTKIKESNDIRAPFLFLLGRGNLRRDFRLIEFASEAPVNAGNLVLRLVPKHAQEFRELFIEVTPDRKLLARLSFVDNNGARTDFLFSSLRENVPIENSLFVFTPPAGVQVVDQ
ncbi:MAG TPA: outer membrane lipoprotein chaperone LolA [Blastocatellia bacterium]|nr:outer membrane lipoprotein chaperone LolA [Blastocatellia bacterium]